MLMGKAILILLMATAVQATAQEKAAGAPAVDPRAATRCGTFYLLLSEKAKGTEISRPYEIAARTLLEPVLANEGEAKSSAWSTEFLEEFLKVPKEGGQFDRYLQELTEKCRPVLMLALEESKSPSKQQLMEQVEKLLQK